MKMIRKLMIIIMGIFLVICAGACNIYPLYLKTMMTKYNFSLKEVNLYGTFINLGLWVGFPMGWIYDKYGPKISCLIGGSFLSGSYIMLYFLLTSDIVSISIIPFLIIALIMGQGSALCFTTSLTTNLKNFRFKESSIIVGLLTAQIALSPSVFTTYREAMKEIEISKYFIIIAIFIFATISVCVFVFRNIKRVYTEDEEKKTYQKYKERKIIKLLILLSIIILVVYTFGIVFNAAMKSSDEDGGSSSKFPLVIVYPCLQMFNFLIVVLEIYGVFDKLYFKSYIDKMVVKQLTDDKIVKIRNEFANKEFKESNTNREEQTEQEKQGKEERSDEISLTKNANNVEGVQHIEIKKEDNKVKKLNFESGFEEIEMGTKKDMRELNQVHQPYNKHNIDSNQTSPNIIIQKEDIQNKENMQHITSDINDTIQIASDTISVNINGHSNSMNINEIISNMYIGKKSDNKEHILLASNNSKYSSLDETQLDIPFKQAILSKNVIVLYIILILGIGSVISNLNNIEFIITSITAHSTHPLVPISNGNNTNSTSRYLDIAASRNMDSTYINLDPIQTSTTNAKNHLGGESSTNIVIYSYVILYFVFTAFSKIMSGLIMDYLIKIRKFFYYLVLVTVFGLFSQFAGIFLTKEAMLISISLAGITHGGYATFLPVFVRNEFGLTHMGKILGVLTSGQAIGSLLISDFIFILPYNINSVNGECYGTKCFRVSYIITTIFCVINLLLSLVMLKYYLATFKKVEIPVDKSNGQIEKIEINNAHFT